MDSVAINSSFVSYFRFSPTNLKFSSVYISHLSFLNFTKFNNLRTSSVAFCCRNPSNPKNLNSQNSDNYSFFLNPFWVLVPIFQTIKNLTLSRTQKWASSLQSYNGKFLHNGAFAVALLSLTSNARYRFSPFVATLAANPTFVSGLFAWFIAQSAKVFLNFFVERRWDLKILFASGGMPSSHSALCTALTTSVAFCQGVADSLFPVCLGFSLIVMYDAIGVRRHAGMQAEVLNMIVEDLFQGHPISQRKLKEFLGHTPSQVLAGALLGIVVACICCQGSLVAT